MFNFYFIIYRQLDPLLFPTVEVRICGSSYIRYIVRWFGHVFHNVSCKAIYFVHLI